MKTPGVRSSSVSQRKAPRLFKAQGKGQDRESDDPIPPGGMGPGVETMTPGRRKSSQQRLKEPAFNRSLLRGIEILRAFRPGVDLLGNSELADRTRLPRATVSRLTQTLTSAGLLDHDRRRRAYRLGAPVFRFAPAMRLGAPVFAVAAALVRELSAKSPIKVGLPGCGSRG